jgi:hypothetical protein
MVKMNISEQILSEIAQYHKINKYITEQDVTAADPTTEPATEPALDTTALPPVDDAGTTPLTDTTTEPQPIDVENDPDVEVVGDENKEGEGGEEELEITDLISAQKNIESKQEEYFNNLFSQLTNLETKLQDMNSVFDKLNSIEAKIEQYREKTPQEKLELRSLDSGPYNQKLSDFFEDKQDELEKSGKNEYILTTDEVEDYPKEEIKQSFNDYGQNDDFKEIKY